MTSFLKSSNKTIPSAPLYCWDIITTQLYPPSAILGHESITHTLNFFHKLFNWSTELDFLNQKFDALVLTNKQETILWASPGFEKMTDYQVNEAIGKKPSFLQGKDTSTETKTQIKANIKSEKPFSSQLINYKKQGEPYLCEINIFPLEGPTGKITHFLALENEI